MLCSWSRIALTLSAWEAVRLIVTVKLVLMLLGRIKRKENNIYCVSLYWFWGSWVNHVNSLTLSFFLFRMWIIVSLSSKGCCGEIQWKTTLHTQLYCVVSRSVMSNSCNPRDYSLPGSSVHGILNTQQIAPTSRAIWQQHGCPLTDLRMKICSSFLQNCARTPVHIVTSGTFCFTDRR